MRVSTPIQARRFDVNKTQTPFRRADCKKLRDAETVLGAGKTVAEVVQTLEVSEQTFYRWKSKFGGMQVEEARRLKELEVENARLKKLLAEAELDKAMLKELAEGNW